MSADEAAGRIASGTRVFIHGAAATPTPLVEALSRRNLISIAHPDWRATLTRDLAATRHLTL